MPSSPPPVLLHFARLPADPPVPKGWRRLYGFDLPETPWDLSGRRLVAVGSIDSEAEAEAALQALARGVGLVVTVGVTGDLRHRVLEDAHRLGDLHHVEVDRTAIPDLHEDDRRLLDALAAGQTVADAAREIHTSLRTANRRLAAIRAGFGVDTTAQAVTRWAALRPSSPGRPADEN